MYWRLCLAYLVLVISLKYAFQISVFCICSCTSYALEPSCSERPSCQLCSAYDPRLQLPYQVIWCPSSVPSVVGRWVTDLSQIGLHKHYGPFLAEIVWDFLCLLAVLFHRHRLKQRGLWVDQLHRAPTRQEQRSGRLQFVFIVWDYVVNYYREGIFRAFSLHKDFYNSMLVREETVLFFSLSPLCAVFHLPLFFSFLPQGLFLDASSC